MHPFAQFLDHPLNVVRHFAESVISVFHFHLHSEHQPLDHLHLGVEVGQQHGLLIESGIEEFPLFVCSFLQLG